MNSLQCHVFGCVASIHVHNQHRGKFDPSAMKCIFISYAQTKRDTNTIILCVVISMSLWTIHFMKEGPYILVLNSMGESRVL